MLIYATITIDEYYDVLKTQEEELTLDTNNMWRGIDERKESTVDDVIITVKLLLLVAKEFFGQFALERKKYIKDIYTQST